MTEQLTMAAKNLKNLGTEITQWENRLEFVKSEAQKATSAGTLSMLKLNARVTTTAFT